MTAHEISRRYGEGDTAVDALAGVSLDIEPGKLTAIMGPSGSGKSTLMHILAALDRPTAGYVTIAGTRLGELSDKEITKLRRKHIGFVFQFFNLLPMLTAEENILLPLSIAGREAGPGEFTELLEAGRPRRPPTHRPSELSGGQQQRVAIARALVSKPTVVFADEPTGNLDSKTGGEILELLQESVETFGQTMVMVTHEARAAAIADRILFLADGLIVKELGQALERARDPPDDGGGHAHLIRVALRGLRGRKFRAVADGVRDRARRRDGERHVRPDRHDRQGVQHDLRRVLRRHGCGRHRGEAPDISFQGTRRRRPPSRRRSRPGAQAATRVEAAAGTVIDESAAKILDRNGKAITARTRRRSASASTRRSRAVQPARPRRGPVARGAERGRDRRRHRGRRRATASATRCSIATLGPVGAFKVVGHRAVRRRGVAGHCDVRGLRHADGAAALRPRRPVRRDLGRGASDGVRPEELVADVKAILPPTARCGPASSRPARTAPRSTSS